MKAYISVSYNKRQDFNAAINTIITTLDAFKIEPFVFVDNYQFTANQERQMMQQAMIDIDNSDLLIAETSEKGIGIGIEVGYAKAKGKLVIYLRQSDADHSTTVAGISDFQIIYRSIDDLKQQLNNVLNEVKDNYFRVTGRAE